MKNLINMENENYRIVNDTTGDGFVLTEKNENHAPLNSSDLPLLVSIFVSENDFAICAENNSFIFDDEEDFWGQWENSFDSSEWVYEAEYYGYDNYTEEDFVDAARPEVKFLACAGGVLVEMV